MKKIKADRFVSIVSILISQTILVTFAQFSDFCQQNALTTIFQFDNSIYFHHLNWFWRWNYRLNQKKPIKDDRLPILFYGGLSSSLTAFDFASKFIRTGFTGFLIPEKIGNFENGDFLLAARNFDGVIFGQKNSSNGHYYVYYPRIWDRSSINAKENPFFHELKTLISIDNSTNTVRTLHYDRKHRELYVAFEYKLMRQSSIVSYDLTLRNIQRMEKEKKIYFSRFITEVVGFWDDQFYHEHNTTMMIYGKNSISILKEDHNVEVIDCSRSIKPKNFSINFFFSNSFWASGF